MENIPSLPTYMSVELIAGLSANLIPNRINDQPLEPDIDLLADMPSDLIYSHIELVTTPTPEGVGF